MKRRQVKHQPLTDLQRVTRRVQEYRLPSGPFDYAARTQSAEEARDFFHEIVRACRSLHPASESGAVIETARYLYHQAWEMACPPDFWEDYQRLRSGDPAGMESAVSFLEADPWFFRSGYIKQKLIRAIKIQFLTPGYVTRLQRVVLAVVDKRYDRDMRNYRNLARKVNTPELREQLAKRAEEGHLDIRIRAGWVLEALGQKDAQG